MENIMFSENKLTSISNELIYFNIREGSLYRLIRSYSLLKTSSELFQDKERSITQIHKCQQHITDEITEQISYDDTNRMNSNHTFNALKVLITKRYASSFVDTAETTKKIIKEFQIGRASCRERV